MTRFAVMASLLAGLFLAPAVDAQPRGENDRGSPFLLTIPYVSILPSARTNQEIVDSCADQVRNETDTKAGRRGFSDFDAFDKGNGVVAMFGTEKERFSFSKCLHANGLPLK